MSRPVRREYSGAQVKESWYDFNGTHHNLNYVGIIVYLIFLSACLHLNIHGPAQHMAPSKNSVKNE